MIYNENLVLHEDNWDPKLDHVLRVLMNIIGDDLADVKRGRATELQLLAVCGVSDKFTINSHFLS